MSWRSRGASIWTWLLQSSEPTVLLFHGTQCGCSISGWAGGPVSESLWTRMHRLTSVCCAPAEGLGVVCVLVFRTQGCVSLVLFPWVFLSVTGGHSSEQHMCLDEDEFSKSRTGFHLYASAVIHWNSLNVNFWSLNVSWLFNLYNQRGFGRHLRNTWVVPPKKVLGQSAHWQ